MNPKFRSLYLIAGAIGLFSLVYYVIAHLSNIDLVAVLSISLLDMLFFYLAYKTYPPDPEPSRMEIYR